jgi:hypothetical protein
MISTMLLLFLFSSNIITIDRLIFLAVMTIGSVIGVLS